VHFIDVGQGDSALVQLPSGQSILIDGGTAGAAGIVIDYLKTAGVTKIDHLISTHPHEDHIGGLIRVIREFPIGKIYMPRATHTTRTYENLLLTIKDKGLRISEAKAGLFLDCGPKIETVFVAPCGESYANLNNYSAVLKLSYGDTAFLFTGGC
jgi:competence protein ComEC